MEVLWEVELLGGLCARPRSDLVGDTPVTHFRTQRAGGLLACLALRLGRGPLTRETLAETLWPYSEPRRALARLAVELSALRSQLEPGGVPHGSVLRADRFTLQLDPATVRADVAAFESLCDRARRAGDPDQLQEALLRYAGPLLAGYDADWVLPERERLAGSYLDAVREQIVLCRKRGDPAGALDAARQATAREPQREASHSLRMRLLLDLGRPAEAREQYALLKTILAERGLTVSAETRRLADEARTAPATPAASPAAPPPTPLPGGTLAVLNTDIVGSTALGRRLGEAAYAAVRAQHHALVRREIGRAGGHEFKETGDGFWIAFETAGAALACARACQEALSGPDMPAIDPPLRVRMALHIAHLRPDATGADYQGLDLHDAARLLGAAHGGQILVSEAAELALRRQLPADCQLTDRGRYRMRDAPGPARLFEVRWPGMPVPDLPPPAAPPERTPALPSALTRFVGRETEVAELTAMLTGGAARLVTLTGFGGSGKTRLAIEAARAVSDRFAGAVWFVSLAELNDIAALPGRVCAAVGADPTGDPWTDLDAVLGAEPALLVLDNVEQLLTGPDERTAAHLLQSALERWPLLVALVTSRQRIGLAAEQDYPVAPLPLPSSRALFEDCARRARNDFQTGRNVEAVNALCRRLEGIPLALELAAAWTRVLSPTEMLDQLPRIRQSRDPSLPARHRSLTAAIEGSYRLLDDAQRQLFRRLSVFRGGWSAEAARIVCEEPDALSLLADLQDHSLITAERDGETTRYRFLETLREFAGEKLAAEAPGEESETRERHSAYFSDLAIRSQPDLERGGDAPWMARFAAEHDNLREALGRIGRADRLRMASHLHRYWMVRGHAREGLRWLADAAADDVSVPDRVRIWALSVAGGLALVTGELDAADAHYTRGLAASLAAGNAEEAGIARNNLAMIAHHRGDLEGARRQYEASLPLWQALGRTDVLATVLSNLGALALLQQELEDARRFQEESLQLQTQAGNLLLRANTLHNLAEVAALQNDLAVALWRLQECLQIRLELDDRGGTAELLFLLARIKTRQGASDEAAWICGAAEAVCESAQIALPAPTRAWADRIVAELRAAADEAAIRTLRDEGRAAHWDRIVARALETLSV